MNFLATDDTESGTGHKAKKVLSSILQGRRIPNSGNQADIPRTLSNFELEISIP